jgi:hypothetical protein
MTGKFLFMAAMVLTLASAPAFAANGPATRLQLLDPLWSTPYTIPDTEIDIMPVDHPERSLGDHIVLAPNWIDGALGATLNIPMSLLGGPLE